MHILLCIPGLGAGGAEKVLTDLAGYWVQSNRVTLLTLEPADRPPYRPLPEKVELIQTGLARPSRWIGAAIWANIRRLLRLRHTILALRPDVVLSFIDQMNVLTLLALAASGVPVVACERVHPGHQDLPVFWRMLRRLSYPLARLITVQTVDAASALPRQWRDRIRVVPNPLSGSAPSPRATIPLTFLAAGRLVRQKGFDLLIEAFSLMSERQSQLVVWGEGAERAALERLAKKHKVEQRVRFAGVSASPGEWLAKGDAFVLSSRYEGFPNALMEAMAAGLAVVAYTCPGGPAELIEDGVTGVLVQNGDVAGLAKAMDRVAQDANLRQALGSSARCAMARFVPEMVMPLWDRLLEEAAEGRPI